jgi:uncharacterized repeat protein (TIGR02543 family)
VYGTGAALPVNGTKAGHIFAGWYANSGLTGSAVTRISTTDTGNKTFYAKWTPATYTVTLNWNGGSGSALTSYVYGTGAALPVNGTKAGHIFTGWYANSGLTGSAVTGISTSDTENKTFYAKWTSAYTVTLNWNGGNGSPLTNYVYGVGATLPADGTKA